jgi:hypothetical protein
MASIHLAVQCKQLLPYSAISSPITEGITEDQSACSGKTGVRGQFKLSSGTGKRNKWFRNLGSQINFLHERYHTKFQRHKENFVKIIGANSNIISMLNSVLILLKLR